MKDDKDEDPLTLFAREKAEGIERLGNDPALAALTTPLLQHLFAARYPYHFTSLGRPVIQFPADMVAVQELIWSVQPDLIVETGIAHGGSLIQSAQMLALLDLTDAIAAHRPFDIKRSERRVIGVDIDIRAHNRQQIEAHPLSPYIRMIEGSSLDPDVIEEIGRRAEGHQRVMLFLDSDHTHGHVLGELHAYAPLVTPGSYCIVFDTLIEDLPPEAVANRPWDRGDNPLTAVDAFLAENNDFERDPEYNAKLVLSCNQGGYLRRKDSSPRR